MSYPCDMLIQTGLSLCQQGRFAEAVTYLEDAVQEAKYSFGTHHLTYAHSLSHLATAYQKICAYHKAEPLFKQAMELVGMIRGTNHPDYAVSLHNLGELYRLSNENRKAELLFRQSLEVTAQSLGTDHPDYIVSLNNLGLVYEALGNYKEAEVCCSKALEITVRVLGPMDDLYLLCLMNLGLVYESLGLYGKAEQLCSEAVKIAPGLIGMDHPDYAQILTNLGSVYYVAGKYEQAETMLRRAMDVQTRILGHDYHVQVDTLKHLGLVSQSLGKYEEAESFYRQALQITENVLGTNVPAYPSLLDCIASVYMDIGKYGEAESFYLQSQKIMIKIGATAHPAYAKLLGSLAALWNRLGKYGEAEKLYNQALGIQTNKEHPDYTRILNNLALVYLEMGEYLRAESLLKQALEIDDRLVGKDHPHYTTSLNNLAEVYRMMEKYEEAESLFRQALAIQERLVGTDHPAYATLLNNLASVYYQSSKKYEDAVSLYRQVLEIRARTIGTEHPHYVNTLNNLANVYAAMGDYAQAESLSRQAFEIRGRVQGKNHSQYADQLNNLAGIEMNLGRPEQALQYRLEAAKIQDNMVRQLAASGGERRIQVYLRTLLREYFNLLSNFYQYFSELQLYTIPVFEVVLRRKAFAIEISALQREVILASDNPHLKNEYDELLHHRALLGQLLMEEPTHISPEQHQERIDKITSRIEMLEWSLVEKVPQMELQQKLEHVQYATIAGLLPDNTAFIEFVWYCPMDFKERKFLSPRYMAFCLLPEPKNTIHVVDLGDAFTIDELISRYRDAIKGDRNMVIVARQTETLESQLLVLGKQLYARLFQPILTKINDTKKLIIAPDGNLTLLPFEVLPQPNGRYVIEDFEIQYVDSGRDLLRFDYREEPQARPLICADPDFDLAGSGPLTDPTSVHGKRSYELEKVAAAREQRNERDQYYFPRLQGTYEEGNQIKAFFKDKADLWIQQQVLDEQVKQIGGPQILHIATHGFFMPKQEEDEQELIRNFGMLGNFGEQAMFRGKRFENPLLRSGLALAGVNAFFELKAPAAGAEDGLLTALDVTGMNLIGTDLVVLSACETGLGEALPGEGVYGLRRAFTLAGARTLILSLWKVPDKETKDLMVNVYTKLLHGTPKAQALREAEREMLNARRVAGQSDSPYYWGAFVCAGDPGKLGKLCTMPLKLRTESN